MKDISRRDLFRSAAALGLSSMLSRDIFAKDEKIVKGSYPVDVGRKFFANGQIRPYKGNTFVCHIPQQGENSEFFYSMLDIYREMEGISFKNKFTMLPPSSYHITFLNGVTDEGRNDESWPSDLPLNANINRCNEHFLSKLQDYKLPCELPIRMKVDLDAPDERSFVMRLVPYDQQEKNKLLNARKHLADFLNLHPKNIETFRFHNTLAYNIQYLDDEEYKIFNQQMRHWRIQVNQKCPVITLGAPEYCYFDDMYAYKRQMYLNT